MVVAEYQNILVYKNIYFINNYIDGINAALLLLTPGTNKIIITLYRVSHDNLRTISFEKIRKGVTFIK